MKTYFTEIKHTDNSKSMLNFKLKSYNLFIFLCSDVCIFGYKCFMAACDKRKRYNYILERGIEAS